MLLIKATGTQTQGGRMEKIFSQTTVPYWENKFTYIRLNNGKWLATCFANNYSEFLHMWSYISRCDSENSIIDNLVTKGWSLWISL